MSYVTNPFEQVRWFLGKNMTSETIPPRAVCGLAGLGDGRIMGKDAESDIPHFRLFKPSAHHESAQDPSTVVFNGPESIEPGKIGRVTMDFPAAALAYGSSITFYTNYDVAYNVAGPVAGKWYLMGGADPANIAYGGMQWAWSKRDAFSIISHTYDQTVTLQQARTTGMPVYVIPNRRRQYAYNAGWGLEPESIGLRPAGELHPIDQVLMFRSYTGPAPEAPWPHICASSLIAPVNLWTEQFAPEYATGLKVVRSGVYIGHASATMRPGPGAIGCGFRWTIKYGTDFSPSYLHDGVYVPTTWRGWRSFDPHLAYGEYITSDENVSVPFCAYLGTGSIVCLVNTTAGAIYSCGTLWLGMQTEQYMVL